MLSGSRCDGNTFGRPSTAPQQARELRLGDGVACRIHFDTVFLSSQPMGKGCFSGVPKQCEVSTVKRVVRAAAARKTLQVGDNMWSSAIAATVSATPFLICFADGKKAQRSPHQ